MKDVPRKIWVCFKKGPVWGDLDGAIMHCIHTPPSAHQLVRARDNDEVWAVFNFHTLFGEKVK